MQPIIEDKIALIEKDVRSVGQKVFDLKIVDADSQKVGIEMLGQIKYRMKRIEYLRREFVDPLNAQVKKINSMFKIQLDPLDKMEEYLKVGITRYMEYEQRKAEVEAEKLRKEQAEKARIEQERIDAIRAEEDRLRDEAAKAKGDEERRRLELEAAAKKDEAEMAQETNALIEVPVICEPPKTVRTESGTFSLKKIWKWEVENEEILRKAHPELYILDAKAVNKLIQEGERNIAGLKVFQASEGAIRA